MDIDSNKLADTASGALTNATDEIASLDYSSITDPVERAKLEALKLQALQSTGKGATRWIGIIVILAVLAGGAFFIIKERNKTPEAQVTQTNGTDATVENGDVNATSTGDNVATF